MLAALVGGDRAENSGLQAYIRSMLRVMVFDAGRRGQLISQAELARYTRDLAEAVTEALHYFIGHGDKSPRDSRRYLAASAAHVIHMLRDTTEDVESGYYNIPREYLEAHKIDPHQVGSDPYRQWTQSRVALARAYFQAGRSYLAQVENLRCRLAGQAYIARFETTLQAIERDGYCLRRAYTERKSLKAGLRICLAALASAFTSRQPGEISQKITAR
jgi:phytoene/squalene synthetase